MQEYKRNENGVVENVVGPGKNRLKLIGDACVR